MKIDNHWILNGIDLSAKFQLYREQVQHMPLTDYKLQDHLHEFLAMSGILLLKESEDYSGSLLGCFPKVELRAMHEDMMNKLGMIPVFNKRLLKKLKKILSRYAAGSLCLTKTRVKLLKLSLKGTREEGRILQAVEAIVNSAKECEMLPSSEDDLSVSYLRPFLHGLLPDATPYAIPDCLNLLLPKSVAAAMNRPDYVVDVYEQNKLAYTNSVGEMKLATVRQGDAVLDLYRTAIFAKECLDKYKLEMVIGFQAIGTTITFYGLNLLYEKLYTYMELTTIVLPIQKKDLLLVVDQIKKIHLIAHVFSTRCLQESVKKDDLRTETVA